MLESLLVFLFKAFLSVALLRAAVGLVSPGNAHNTWGRALGAAIVIHVLAVPLLWLWWVLLIPLVLYLVIWFVTITSVFRLRAGQALAVGIVGTVLSWAVHAVAGIF